MSLKYSYIASSEKLSRAYERLREEPYLFIDTETAGNRIRLVQLGNKEEVFIFDLFELREEGVKVLKDLLQSRGIVGHNLKFDLKHLYGLGIEPYAVFDTMIASQLLGDTERHSLQKLAMHYLGLVIDKSLQLSNWASRNLTKEQLEYAALDVKLVKDLFYLLLSRLNQTPHREEILLKTRTSKVFGLQNPVAIVEMAFVQEVAKLELNGLPVDQEELRKTALGGKEGATKKGYGVYGKTQG